MTTDNRITLNTCDAITGFVGDGPVDVDATAGFFYEGTNAITTQHTNTDEHIYTTSIGGTRDLSDATCYLILKDNLVQTAANGGVQYVLSDGTDRIGFGVGGNDATGIPLDTFWNGYKLDVTERANAPYNNVYAGVLLNLTVTAITQVGLGTVHLAKAQGNVDNIKLDRFSFIANGSYAHTINGGTVGTPETMADVTADSITNGWATFSNPFGALYYFFAPCEFGNPVATADVYFTATDEQWLWLGGSVGATHFPMRIVGNVTDTIDIKWTSLSITNVGTRSEFIAGDPNVNVMQFDNVTFNTVGTITFTTQSAGNRFCDNSTFNNCGQVSFSSIDADNCTFNGTTDALGAVEWSATPADVANQTDFTFNSDGTGHAIEINLNTASLTTYNISNYVFDGYAGQDGTAGNRVFYIDNALDGDVTINLSNSQALNQIGTGNGFSFEAAPGYTGTVTIVSTVTLTLTGIRTDSEVRIINLDDTTNFNKELAGIESTTGSLQSVSIVDGGTGYTVSDTLTVVGGTGTPATITVDAVSGGVITAASVAGAGSYTSDPINPASVTGGTGNDATFNLGISGSFSYNYDSGNLVNVAIIVFNINFVEVRIEQPLASTAQTIPIQQRGDRVYSS